MYTATLTAGKHVSPGPVNSPFHQSCRKTEKNRHTNTHCYFFWLGQNLTTRVCVCVLFSKRRWMKQVWLWSCVTCNCNGCALWFVYLSLKPRLVFKRSVSCISPETGRGLRVVFFAFEQSHCLWQPAPERGLSSAEKNVLTVIFHSLYLCCRMP